MKQNLYIYHTNDVHSHFENWPRIAKFLQDKRREHERQNEKMLLFDIGDFIDRFHPITEATRGKANVQLLNQLQYDAVTIGNNEGITLNYEELSQLYENARFSVLVANLFGKDGKRPPWLQPYRIISVSDTLRIGVIGVTVYFKKFYELLGWNITPPLEWLNDIVHDVRKQADVVILLSHLGINDDEFIAQTVSGIDLILGAHTHHVLSKGKWVNDTLLCGAGKYGQHIGVVKLSMPEKKWEAEVVDIAALSECEDTKQMLMGLEKESLQQLDKEAVAELHQELPLQWFSPSPFAQLLASALKEWCSGDIGMVNAGVLLEPLPKGIVTKKDLHRICPHPINPCKVYLRGDELKEVILQAHTETMKRLSIRGFGFRGKIMGQMAYDGVKLQTEKTSDGSEHVRHIFINGKELRADQTYAVATIDMFTFGHFYPQIHRAPQKIYYMPEFLRDLLAWKLAQPS
ncbi:bifunctional UDP-sugar hydrolase/5'-nucleotidase [Anoxybacillus rupiensis]|uniref:Bifunctional UDP-sugar hydrolase/5'-nucleotidase n=1 Tax=Anoxybacteroides rupiense TaxID=311460 RepID=A0ABD5IX87_9BACL|nr:MULTISPECIES: bifunctional UDP-sugar hydrolase/5'-nucleotidase [Anoxybacillus]KXG09626.1 Mannosylglucosyl-3-phosphoglycerate phosphatase [Anoxybacillus sp. P3H1B]MBB3908923.1 2',3'-cyclic-nucleotide 2'-phosphodiesterase (5'-nucleotidase family) [Anoxybacillus rupiensis]MBS2772292.1 bifunctional metallophosphatase/5'-nucleotidase [Anoxybacillus rupiensis]MDE8564917.1 bifunctional UDP-sugar hydrolase/5'-nucleotidase [Anoxybacillus rupiensis]MED5052404.1 bifunctional UDP-sugar hydrolase/5'-nuc